MPLTAQMRQDIDAIRNYLFGGGYPDPVANAEQLSFLFFFYLVEGIDSANVLRAKVTKLKYVSMFAGDWALKNPLNAREPGQTHIPREQFRWSLWAKGLSGESLVRFLRDEVFAFFAEIGDASATNFMTGARLTIDEPTVLTQVVTLVDGLHLDRSDADTKGDLFEHVLRQIKQAGELGQFRTPRHVIRAIVDIINPQIGETIYDPAAGTAGFLVAAYNHIRLNNSDQVQTVEVDGKTQRRGYGERLTRGQVSTLQNHTFYGNDVDPKMVRLATMNLTLRGLPNVLILLRNVLTTTLDAERKAALGLPESGYNVVLANPPFSGRVDKDRIVDDVKIGTSTATELLFIKYMMDSLKANGRCGVVVPEGVLFGSTGAHKELRRQLIENNRVEAVLSLPGGVFQPYSGVKTSVLIFRKGGQTENVLFLHIDNDGYKLDANHDQAIDADDLPDCVETYRARDAKLVEWESWSAATTIGSSPSPPEGEGWGEGDASKAKPTAQLAKTPWTNNWWFASLATLRANEFNLSAGRYRPMNASQVAHRNPRELLDELAALETEIVAEVEALRVALAEQAG